MGAPEVDLRRKRDLGDLLGTAFALFGRHSTVFFTMTLIVVAPAVLLIDGLWGRQLAEGADADPETGSMVVSLLLTGLLIPAFVTALHVRVVLGLAEGSEPTVGGAFSGIADRVGPALGAILAYSAVVLIGFVAFIVPGIYLSIRCFFAAQSAVVEGTSPVASLQRSAELVKGSWWRVFGLLLVAGLLAGVVAAVIEAIAGTVGDGVVYVVVRIVIESLTLSFIALFGTLLFFDLRNRAAAAQPAL